MAQYLMLLRDEGGAMSRMTEEENQAHFQKFVVWAEKLHREGMLRGVERLLEGGRAVRQRGGRVVVDGPYVEGKETVLGFFVIEAESYEEAAKVAGECPAVPVGGSVELREIGEFPKPR